MPYCGRCLNVGRAGKGSATGIRPSLQPRQRCATSSGSTDSEPGQHAIAGSRRSWTSYRGNSWPRAVGRSFAGCCPASLKRTSDQLAPDVFTALNTGLRGLSSG